MKVWYLNSCFTRPRQSYDIFIDLQYKGYQVARMRHSGNPGLSWIWIFSEKLPNIRFGVKEFIVEPKLEFEKEICNIIFLEDHIYLEYPGGYQFEIPYDFSQDILGILGKLEAPRKPYY